MGFNPFDAVDGRLSTIEQLLHNLNSLLLSKQTSEEQLLSPSKACEIFQPNISRGTLYNWEKAGLIKSHSIGGKKFYKLSDILADSSKIKRYSPSKVLAQEAA